MKILLISFLKAQEFVREEQGVSSQKTTGIKEEESGRVLEVKRGGKSARNFALWS